MTLLRSRSRAASHGQARRRSLDGARSGELQLPRGLVTDKPATSLLFGWFCYSINSRLIVKSANLQNASILTFAHTYGLKHSTTVQQPVGQPLSPRHFAHGQDLNTDPFEANRSSVIDIS